MSRAGWVEEPVWAGYRSVSRESDLDATVLSLHRGLGVVVKGSVAGNHNRTPEDLSRYQRVAVNDIVVNRMKAWQGSAGVAGDAGIISAHYLVFEPHDNRYDPRYLNYLLGSRAMIQQYEAHSNGVRLGQWELSRTTFGQLSLLRPPLAEQRRIADYLDAENARLDRTRQALLRSQELAEERFRAAASEEISPTGWAPSPSEGNSLSGDTPYQFLARTGSGHTPSRSVAEYWEDCCFPWVTTADVSKLRADRIEVIDDTTHHVSELGMANSSARLHPEGTVFFSRTASVGFSGIMGTPMATSQDFFTWTCGSRLHNRFLLWSLRSMRWQGVFDRLMFGSTHNTIYVPDLMGLRGPVPEVSEQVRAADKISEMSHERSGLLDAVDRQLRLIAERKQALITAAVTGEITV